MWSLFRNIGDTLRLLAPVAFLAILCGRDSPVMRFFQQFDRALRNALFPPPRQQDYILLWLRSCLPEDTRLTCLDVVWSDASIICELVNSVIPGACIGHDEDTEPDLMHAQRLVEQYLGVSPIFSDDDASHMPLSTYQECRLSHYMNRIKDAISQMSPPVSRAGSPLLNFHAYTFDYVARGMGIIVAYKDRNASFYIYPTAQQSLEPGDISVQIKGPGICYGSTTVPAIYGRAHIVRQAFLKLGKKQSISNIPLPLTQGPSYMRNYNTSIENKYYIPKLKNDIDVKITIKSDRVKVIYTPTVIGVHEISLISKGCHVIGSPYVIHVETPLTPKQDSTDYSDEDPTEQVIKNDRKIVFSVVDFVTEKMILTEDGRLEKISNNDADLLLKSKASVDELTDKYLQISKKLMLSPNPDIIENDKAIAKNCNISVKFKLAAKKIITMMTVCREFKKCIMKITFHPNDYKQRQIRPDVVNSTISDNFQYEDRQRNMESDINESSANVLRQKFKTGHSSFNNTTENTEENTVDGETSTTETSNTDDFEYHKITGESRRKIIKTGASIDIIVSSFDDDEDMPVPLSLPPLDILPEIEEILERPKSPVFKVLQNVKRPKDISKVERAKRKIELNGDFSIDFNEDDDTSDEMLDAREINYGRASPLLDPHEINYGRASPSIDAHEINYGRASPSINFRIGEPVTPTRTYNQTPIDPDMDSVILASNLEEALVKYDLKMQRYSRNQESYSDDSDSSDFMTPMRQTPFEQMTDSEILKMYEGIDPNAEQAKQDSTDQDEVFFESDDTNSIHDFNVQKGGVNIIRQNRSARNAIMLNQNSFSSNGEDRDERESNFSAFNSSVETWDSAYISIDEVNSSPDANSTPRSDFSPRPKLYCIEETSQERNTPTWEVLNGVEGEENDEWKSRAQSEIQKEKEFNESCKGSTFENETNFHLKSLRIYKHNISIIDEDDNMYRSLEAVIHRSAKDNMNLNQFSKSDTEINKQCNKKQDFSASDFLADVKKSNDKKNISTAQTFSELNRENLANLQKLNKDSKEEQKIRWLEENTQEFKGNIEKVNQNNHKNHKLSKMVADKKDYWDSKIKVLQSNDERKSPSLQKKKVSQLKRNDSLSKKRAKQLLSKSPNVTEKWKKSFEANSVVASVSTTNQSLVARWKEYWNDRVDKDTKAYYELHKLHGRTMKNSNSPIFSNDTYYSNEIEPKNEEKLNETSDFLDISEEEEKVGYLSFNNNHTRKSEKVAFRNKYHPTPMNLQSITERINKFLESLPSTSPVEEIEDIRFSTPEIQINKIIPKNDRNFDSNNNKMNNEMLLKMSLEKEKLNNVGNDCQYKTRIQTFQQMSNNALPTDITRKSDQIKVIAENNQNTINTGPYSLEIRSSIEHIFEKENLPSFPAISKIKAQIEKSAQEARINFLKHKSKTIDIPKYVAKMKLRKSYSMSKICIDAPLPEKKLMRNSSIDEMRMMFERNTSRDNINLNISTESIPSIKNRRLRLEKHLQTIHNNISNLQKHQEKKNNNVNMHPINIVIGNQINHGDLVKGENKTVEEIPVFKPIGDIVKAFEHKTILDYNIEDRTDRIKVKDLVVVSKANPGKFLKSVAEKGEGTKEYPDQEDTLLLPNRLDQIDASTAAKTNHILADMCTSLTNMVTKCKNDIKEKEIDHVKVVDLEDVKSDREYKSRFKQAKNFFQQLDKTKKGNNKESQKHLNECEILLLNTTDKDVDSKGNNNQTVKEKIVLDKDVKENDRQEVNEKKVPEKPARKNLGKSLATPLSDTEYEMHKRFLSRSASNPIGLRKISEKFMVEGLFHDIIGDSIKSDGFKGIPHKSAVLATFRSMESVHQQSSYEIATSQMEDFAKKNGIINAQTHHTDFPHLPMTEPNKYRSRSDAAVSVSIKRNEHFKSQKVRRYSEPTRPKISIDFVTNL